MENFDSYGVLAGTFPVCWSRPVLNTTTPFPSLHTTNHSAPASIKISSSSAVFPTYVITPAFADNISTLRVKFWLKALNVSNSGTIDVGLVSDPTDVSTFESVGVITPTSLDWTQYEVMFNQASLIGENRHIAFKHNTVLSNSVFWLDDVVVDPIPNCVKPVNIISSNETQSSAQIAWTPYNITDDSWWIFWKEVHSENYDSALITSNPHTLTGLSSSSIYNVYLKTNCCIEVSEPSVVLTFFTSCDVVTIFPFVEDFNHYSVDSYPHCWSRPVLNGTYPKIVSNNYHSSPSSVEIRSTSDITSYVVSPQFGEDINSLQVRFWAKPESTTSSGVLEVGVMSDPTNIETFELVSTITPTSTRWAEYEVLFNNTTLTGLNNCIAFRQNTIYSWYYWLDDITVDYIPSCARPTELVVSNIFPTSASISFTPGNISDVEWKIYYREVGTSAWTEESVYANSYQISGLTANTQYEAYITTLCNDDTYSSASSMIDFRTA